MADLRLRAGVAIRPQVLVFATFGGAWAECRPAGYRPRRRVAAARTCSAGAWAAAPKSPSIRIGAPGSTTNSPTSIPSRSNYPGGTLKLDPDSDIYRGSLIYRF